MLQQSLIDFLQQGRGRLNPAGVAIEAGPQASAAQSTLMELFRMQSQLVEQGLIPGDVRIAGG